MGKFFDRTDEYVWNLSLDGGPDEEVSFQDSMGSYYGLTWGCPLPEGDQLRKDMLAEEWKDVLFDEMRKCTAGYILIEDNEGFVTVEYFSEKSEMVAKWKEYTEQDLVVPEGVLP